MKKAMVKGLSTVLLAATVFSGSMVSANAWFNFFKKEPAVETYCSAPSHRVTESYIVTGTTYYLALRSGTAYRAENEIGRIYNGEMVEVVEKNTGNSEYWYVYANSLGKYGYVNRNYLMRNEDCYYYCYYDAPTCNNNRYVVSGVTHYLAIRTETAYRAENEIGKVYNGEYVDVLDRNTGNADYWYVYVPSCDMYGYVNNNYLV